MEAQERIDRKAKEVLEKSRVASMIPSALQAKFDRVLKAEQLFDVRAVFGDPDFFDEVPLYSRYKHVEFLSRYGDVDTLLLQLALAYLDRVCTEVRLRSKRLAAITVTRDDEDYIVPSIFVCNRQVKTQLAALSLSLPRTRLGKEVDHLATAIRPKTFAVFEDRQTVPDLVRVFVGHKSPPRGIVSLDIFARRIQPHGLQTHRRVG